MVVLLGGGEIGLKIIREEWGTVNMFLG